MFNWQHMRLATRNGQFVCLNKLFFSVYNFWRKYILYILTYILHIYFFHVGLSKGKFFLIYTEWEMYVVLFSRLIVNVREVRSMTFFPKNSVYEYVQGKNSHLIYNYYTSQEIVTN